MSDSVPVHVDDQWCDSSLISAAADGLADKVQQLIAAKADLELQDDWGMTALSHAIENDHPHIVKLLTDANAALNYTNSDCVPLISTVEKGFLQIVEVLLAAKANVNIEDANGRTALWHAQNNGHEDIVEVLLASNASYGEGATAAASDADTVSVSEGTQPTRDKADENEDMEARAEMNLRAARALLLYDAACETNVVVLETLLSMKASLDWRNADGHTPLIQAVVDKNMAAVLLLLEHRADVDMSDSDNRTALIHAAIKNDGPMLETLLDASASVDHRDSWDMTALGYVADSDVGYAQLLIRKKATVDDDLRVIINVGSEIITAAKTGNCKEMEALLMSEAFLMSEASPNIGEYGKSALTIALERGKTAVAQLLIDAKAIIDPQQSAGQQALTEAVCKGSSFTGSVEKKLPTTVATGAVDASNTSTIEHAIKQGRFHDMTLLLRAKASFDPTSHLARGAFIKAVVENESTHVRSLLTASVSPNVVNERNETALMCAVVNQQLSMANLLIDAKAEVGPNNSAWNSIWKRIGSSGDMSTTAYMLNIKVSPNAVGNDAESPLMHAVSHGNFHVVYQLIAAKANVNPEDEFWGDALIQAAKLRKLQSIGYILEVKITPGVADMHAKTALMYASENGDVSIMRRLLIAALETDPATNGVRCSI